MGEDEVNAVTRFLESLVEYMGLEVDVQAQQEEEEIRANLTGPDRSMLLSNSASLLNSMEYLTAKAFGSPPEERTSSIVLDSDDYRKHREAELVLLAQMASEKVMDQRRPLSLQPMTPKERRIVHLELAAIDGVRTESRGDGDNRSITIYPQ